MNIIVTGASRGIGYELVKKLVADSNNQVVGIARSQRLLNALSDEIREIDHKGLFHPLVYDLVQSDYSATLVPLIQNCFSHVDILINNAGLLINKPVQLLTDDDFDQTFNVNVKSVFRLVRDLLPMFTEGAHVVNISSMGGFQGSAKFPGLSLYSAAKGALAVLTESLAVELLGNKISVNALALGAVQTEMLAQAFPGYEAPLSPNEMANFIGDFALNGHQYFNGKILPVTLSTP
jgi:NAD(P)-dependent dehydrogenase (short-subunit alcohol dehydrogenase family)